MNNKWNLVSILSKSDEERAFFLPLASKPPGKNDIRQVDQSQYEIIEQYESISSNNPKIKDVSLEITITPMQNSCFENEDDLPDPSYRLHAIDNGTVTFYNNYEGLQNCLVLDMGRFFFPVKNCSWYWRWIEASCLPAKFIYESIDPEHLRNVLESVTAPESIHDDIPFTYGLLYPEGVNQSSKSLFIDRFFQDNNKDIFFMVAKAGAYLGTAALHPAIANDPQIEHNRKPRQIKLHARYVNHSIDDPRPLNPRELFHLLFGDNITAKSIEAENHPLLKKIDNLGENDNTLPATKRMLLRPPLRTSARVMWEAEKEIDISENNWSMNGNCSNLIYNSYIEKSPPRSPNYVGEYKCNVFGYEITTRSGFKAPVLSVRIPNNYHYLNPLLTNKAALRNNNAGSENNYARYYNKKFVDWGRGWDRILANIIPSSNRIEFLNNLINNEGRCFILNRWHDGGMRHHLILNSVELNNIYPNQSLLFRLHDGNRTLRIIRGTVYEAYPGGARKSGPRNYTPMLNSDPTAVLSLIELKPGRDPDIHIGNLSSVDAIENDDKINLNVLIDVTF